MNGIDTHRLHLMLLLIHTCELQQGFGHPKKMIQVVLADDPEAINDTFASRIYIYPDETSACSLRRCSFLKPVLLLHKLCLLPAFVTFIDPLLSCFFWGGMGRRRRAGHIGMQRCLQEVEVLDLDWGPMRSPLESLPSTNFIQWGYSYT